MIDHPALTLRGPAEEHLREDRWERVGFTLDAAGEGIAPEGPEAHLLQQRLLAGLQRHARIVYHDERAVALYHRARGGQVERYDRNLLQPDVLPDVELGPVRERKYPKALTG